jgi:hypothetical protein
MKTEARLWALVLFSVTPALSAAQGFTLLTGPIDVSAPRLTGPNYNQVATVTVGVAGPTGSVCFTSHGAGVASITGVAYDGSVGVNPSTGSLSFQVTLVPASGAGTYTDSIFVVCGNQVITIPVLYTVDAATAAPTPGQIDWAWTPGQPRPATEIYVAYDGPVFPSVNQGYPNLLYVSIECVGDASCPAGTSPAWLITDAVVYLGSRNPYPQTDSLPFCACFDMPTIAGVYRAQIRIHGQTSAGPDFQPAPFQFPDVVIPVTLTAVDPNAPTIALSSTAVSLTTAAGSRSTVTSDSVTSSGAGTLSGLTVSTSYSGAASGWLSVTLDGSATPTGLALTADGTHLVPGTYAATATILQTGAPASARVVSVTLTVSEPTLSSVVKSILNLGTLSAEVQHYLDSLGNKDGVFDLGDILALLDRTGQQLDARTLQAILAIPAKPTALPKDSSESFRPTIRP